MADRGNTRLYHLHQEVHARLLPAAGIPYTDEAAPALAYRPGVCAQNVLYVPANVVDGDTITFKGTTFEVDIINTDSGVNTHAATGALNGTDRESQVILASAPVTPLVVGQVLRIESEMLKVLRVNSTTLIAVQRGYAGTTIATHAANTDVFVSNANPATNVQIPLVTTLTPVAFCAAFVAVFNALPAGGIRPTSQATPAAIYEHYRAYPGVLGLDAGQQIVIVALQAGVDATATTEEFTASTDNVWGAATMTGGVDPGVAAFEVSRRVPTAAEELQGEMHFAFPFTVRDARVEMVVTATGQRVSFGGEVHIGYVESTDATMPGTVVTLRNQGPASTAYITGFAATNTVSVLATE